MSFSSLPRRSFPIDHAGVVAVPPPFDTGLFEHRTNVSNPAQVTQLLHSQIELFFFRESSLGAGSGWTDDAGTAITPDPTLNFVPVSSSDSVTAGAGDKILTRANLIWAAAGSPHSWWVDERPDGSQICVDCSNASSINGLTVAISPGGLFAGGTTLARPTAADEFVPINNAAWGESNNSASWLNFQRAKNATSYRFLQCRTNWSVNLWAWEIAKAEAGWSNPNVFGMYGTSATAPVNQQITYSACFTTATPMMGVGATANIAIQLNLPGVHLANGAIPNVAAYQVANAYSGKFPLYVIGMGTTTALNIGYLGQLQNIWCGNTNLTTATDGRWYGTNATDRAKLQIGVLVIPWNQSVPGWVAGSYIGDWQIYGRTT